MSLYSGKVWVFPPGDDFGYETGFSVEHWMNGEEDWGDVEITTYNPETGEEYSPAYWEILQIFEHLNENFKAIDKAIDDNNFREPDIDF